MVPIEQKDGTSAAVETVDFPLPLPACCRACGKRKRLLAVGADDDDDAVWRRSGGGDALVDGALRRCLRLAPFDDLERQRIGALGEIDRNAGHGGGGAVLDREGEIIAIAAQIEIGITPGVELGGSTQGLS